MHTLTASALIIGLTSASTIALAGNCNNRGAGMAPYAPAGYTAPGMVRGYDQNDRGAQHAAPQFQRVGFYGDGYDGKHQKTGHHAMDSHKAADAKPAGKDIVDIASTAGGFDTLVVAVKKAGLVDTLKGDGPFTVFAPTDEAFAKIPKADMDALLADKVALTRVLTYHVVPGKVMSADVANLKSAKTVEGQSIRIDTSDGVKVDNANVVKTDIVASNGVIHVIDTVIMPN